MTDHFERQGFVDIKDRVVGLLPHIIARPTVYCGFYDTNYLKRWTDFLDETTPISGWGTRDVRLYAQYSEHSKSFAMFAVPSCKKNTMMPVVAGLREYHFLFNWQDKWFKSPSCSKGVV